jgi:catechol 2,3-dioxygenase-like lactoylglutathione lyase family enzyme
VSSEQADTARAFTHVNIVARDWRALADFYVEALGCEPAPPERDYSGEFIERLTGITGARVRGIHLRTPGRGAAGPTIEVFTYEHDEPQSTPPPNRQGFAHIAFVVDDVSAALERLIAAGGSTVGELVEAEVAGAGRLTAVYARDPEGNIVELQRWD